MKNFLTIILIVTSSFIPFIAFAQTQFMRDLFLGISGPDVLELQKILNKDPETKIADIGEGSSGMETEYFGSLTKNAVNKFQIKYSDYVLKPVGLSVPTGYVGFYTREFLNKYFNSSSTTDTTSLLDNNPKTKTELPINSKPFIESITPEKISGSSKVVIIGKNFTDSNQILITLENPDTYKDIKSTQDGTRIEFEFKSSIQKVFDEKYSKLSKKQKEIVTGQFPETQLNIVIRNKNGDSNIKKINFYLK